MSDLFDVASSAETSKETAYSYRVAMEDGSEAQVHCIYLEQWGDATIRDRFSVEMGGIELHSLAFTGSFKMNGLYWVGSKPGERERAVFDLWAMLTKGGLEVRDLVANMIALGVHFDIDDCLDDLPRRFEIDGQTRDLQRFVDEFSRSVEAVWEELLPGRMSI